MTDKQTQAKCDRIVAKSARTMVEVGASVPMVLDRMLTYATAQACSIGGSVEAAKMFRHIAAQIEAGVFAHVEPGKGR